jgi:hypothetical protein
MWPALPSDDDPAPHLDMPILDEDPGRSARLRGEQQGSRWIARRS